MALSTNYNYINNVESENEEEEEKMEDDIPEGQPAQNGGGILSYAYNSVYYGVKSVVGYVWSSIVWIKNLFFWRDDATANLSGEEFKTKIKKRIREM